MATEKLNHDEINVLIEALDSWIEKGSSAMLVTGLIGAMISKGDQDGKFESEMKKKELEYEQDKRQRKIAATKLKAKLYEMMESDQFNRVVSTG